MKAFVLFDSKHGNTEKIAQAIAAGLKEGGVESVECRSLPLPGRRTSGTRTCGCSAPRPITAACRSVSPPLLKNALREDHPGVKAAIFDTRMKDFPEGCGGQTEEDPGEEGKADHR